MASKSLMLAAAGSSLLLRKDDQKVNDNNSCGQGDHYCSTKTPFTVMDSASDNTQQLYRIMCWGNFGAQYDDQVGNFSQYMCPPDFQDQDGAYTKESVARGLTGYLNLLAMQCSTKNTTSCTVGDNWYENEDTWCGQSVNAIYGLCQSSQKLNEAAQSSIELKFNKKDGKKVSGYCKVDEEKIFAAMGLNKYVEQCKEQGGDAHAENWWKAQCQHFNQRLYGNHTNLYLTHDANTQSCD